VVRTLPARVAALTRHRSPDDPDLAAARRQLESEHTARYVRELVDRAPVMTPEQRDRIAVALRSGSGVAA